MADASNVMLTTLVPGLGAIISLAMYASPVQAVLTAGRNRGLGDLNPMPFVVTVANCIAWLLYGLLKQDPFVTSPNAPGVVVGLFCMLSTYGLADDKIRSRMRLLLCVEVSVLSFLGVLTSFACKTIEQQQGLWGGAGNVVSLIYYGAPLSTMTEVIRSRNSSSILLPMTVMNTLNAALWTVYGVAMGDIFIIAPNGIGLVLSLAQLLLVFLFPSRPRPKTPTPNATQHEAAYGRVAIIDEEGGSKVSEGNK
mmetsp:Transcript_11382/g.19961  ORF Transcript_11382/g.19961 Transcript_11382/m.19961 type:complete len:252 (-) Transcript_11382:689-1444(-)|eukprot:CAMPEP_0119103970 /NCGR_PEP_ID=MMETSP1180-20130426/2299_1 /TAXON_ID=3052 ORGANISM="Chlamydomonas cf sp, Strain CCMP681" /NCGR_SAMPLE_ID=MMETSP1180 /ASSEMBLY_ACC=CAM_ASM_000741 /LENGTH=251 /DNA_ID=CAMNT_0007088605 /DNA_START=119 /DNA_END=874 /DNA_ORIENTATION=-